MPFKWLFLPTKEDLKNLLCKCATKNIYKFLEEKKPWMVSVGSGHSIKTAENTSYALIYMQLGHHGHWPHQAPTGLPEFGFLIEQPRGHWSNKLQTTKLDCHLKNKYELPLSWTPFPNALCNDADSNWRELEASAMKKDAEPFKLQIQNPEH